MRAEEHHLSSHFGSKVPAPLSDLPLPKQTPLPCHSSQNEKDTVLVQEHPCQPRQAPGSLEAYTWFNDITDDSNAIFQLPQEPTEQQLQVTHRKFNKAPEKWWLEDYFPIGKVTFQGLS